MMLRPGWRTTENAWVAIGVALMLLFPSRAMALALIVGLYCLGRGVAKIGKGRFGHFDELERFYLSQKKSLPPAGPLPPPASPTSPALPPEWQAP